MMSSAISHIINDQKKQLEEKQQQHLEQSSSSNITIAEPMNNQLDSIHSSVLSMAHLVTTEVIDLSNKDSPTKEEVPTNDYDAILKEIKDHEDAMELAVKNADEISTSLKDSIMYYLNIRSANKNGILFRGVPEVLQASARLLDISISGRYKIANLKKMRASIIKDSKGGASDNKEFNLMSFMEGNE